MTRLLVGVAVAAGLLAGFAWVLTRRIAWAPRGAALSHDSLTHWLRLDGQRGYTED